jgi:hypothetical protein
VSTYAATTALPYPHPERATAGLRGELRRQIVQTGGLEPPRWDTLEVTGPVETIDARGHTWFEYRATVEAIDSSAG